MALSEEFITLDQDLSSAKLAVTRVGSAINNTEDANPSHESINEHPTREQSEQDGKREKYSTMLEEVCPTRDREVLRKKLANNLELRYLNEIKSLKDRIKSSLSCNQEQCPMMKERLNQHQNEHHKFTKACSTKLSLQDQGINVSPTLSRMRLTKFTFPISLDGRPVQTDLTMRDISPSHITGSQHKKTCEVVNTDSIPLRRSETREVIPTVIFYKEYLQNEILNWVQNIPMLYTYFTSKDIKDNIVNNLAEKLDMLAKEVFDNNYELRTLIEIENCLSRLPIWLPGSKRDQVLFKDTLIDKLWKKIQEMNEKFLGVSYDHEPECDILNDESVLSLKTHQSYEKEVVDWIEKLQLKNDQKPVSRRQVVDLIMKRLSPLLKIPLHTTSYKLILKGEIIDILDDLPLVLSSPKYKTVHLNRFAEELANRLLSIQLRNKDCNYNHTGRYAPVYQQCANEILGARFPKGRITLKKIIQDKIRDCLNKVHVCHRNDLRTEICSTFLDSQGNLLFEDELSIQNKVCQYLRDTGKISADRTHSVAKMIIGQVKDAIKDTKATTTTSFDSVIPELSGTISVYRWGESTQQPVTSTPKKPSNKEIPKLNKEEQSYMDKVAALIRSWMNTLPIQYNEDKEFKQTIINDLAGDIMDELKVEQLAPDAKKDKEKYLKYLMYRWLYRFEFFEDATIREDAKPFITDFLNKLQTIPVPQLTASQHGTRQAMEHIKHMQGERAWEDDYVAKGIDVLEDQISVWMNEQPTEIYANKDKGKRDKMIHDLALTLQDRLRNKSPEDEIDKDINKWLQKVVTSKEKEHIGVLTQNLKEKVINLPQDQTIEARHEERKRDIADRLAMKRKAATQPTQDVTDVKNLGNIEGDPDKTIREFINKFLEHKYDIDDPMARAAFSHLLKTELRKISPLTRKEVYEHYERSQPHPHFLPEGLKNELEYIKVISDWLKEIAIDPSYNTPGNKDRIDFVIDLAKNIQEIDAQRIYSPSELDVNYLIASVVVQSINSYGLPIHPDHKNNTPLMANLLLEKLNTMNIQAPCCEYAIQPQQTETSSPDQTQSLSMSDIKEQNLSEFIADYIRINGKEIADDEVKLEAWTARLLKEVQKMIHDGADPATIDKAQVYNKFSEVSIPGDEAVKRYSLEISYVKEISDWIKNLPLLPIENQPAEEEKRVKMISELAEKMAELQAQKNANPNDNTAEKRAEEYIATWISRLPLNPNKEIVFPIVISQLLNRMERDNKEFQLTTGPSPTEVPYTGSDSSKSFSKDSDKKNKDDKQKKSQSVDEQSSNVSVNRSGSKMKCPLPLKICKQDKKNPASVIVETIENWSKKLPIKGDNKEAVKAMKADIATKLYQKICELNADPRVVNDDIFYREMLGDEIDTQLENVPQNSELQKNREKLKEGLLDTILENKKLMKEQSIGDNYKHKLESTIDSSIPDPIQTTQTFDPGFEIYKSNIANMFILENFDHANDEVKEKHVQRLKSEIDKYFGSAQKRNILPITKDQMYNELYSALFKVPVPSEKSVTDEVEQVKLRCEIDSWFESLPMKEPDGVGEMLEWDKILSILTKRIHEIEKNESKPDRKIHKEIIKWLEKLPLLPGNKGVDHYADELQALLKSTAESRKYIAPENKASSKGKSKESKKAKENQNKTKSKKGSPNISQEAGPSSEGQNWVSSASLPRSKATTARPCCQVSPMANKKSADILVDIIEEWCDQLPLISNEETNKVIRDNITTRIIILLSELNTDPEIFNDDVVYDELLDEEIENIFANLPVSNDFEQSKAARKYQLKDIIKSIKPLVKDEKDRHEYREELNNTVTSILKEPQNTTADKTKLYNKIKDEVIENFVQYSYNQNNEEAKRNHKENLHEAVVSYFTNVKDKGIDENVDPLVRRNQLLCELGKIPITDEALKEEVGEIKMKKELEQFFQEISVPEGEDEDKIMKNLSKRLYDLEKSGHTCSNEKKMKAGISRCLKKLNKDVSPNVIDDFVAKLKDSEAERKTLPLTSSQTSALYSSHQTKISEPIDTRDASSMYAPPYEIQRTFSPQATQQGSTYTHVPEDFEPNQSKGQEQWFSTPPPRLIQGYKPEYKSEFEHNSPYASDVIDKSMNNTVMSYKNFEGGRNLRSSSPAPRGFAIAKQSVGQSPVNYESFEAGPLLSSSVVEGRGGPGQPSLHITHKSMSKGQTRSYDHSSTKEIASGPFQGRAPLSPTQAQSSYGQTAAPRQSALSVQQSAQRPRQTQTPHNITNAEISRGNTTSDSLFDAPIFRPGPLHRPLPVPVIQPSPTHMHGMQLSRRTVQNFDDTLVPPPYAFPMAPSPLEPPVMGGDKRQIFTSSDEEEICKCEMLGKNRRIPFCLLSMQDFLDEYFAFNPYLYFPECIYY